MQQLKAWPNNRGRAEQLAPYARRRIDSLVGPEVPSAHAPASNMATILHALHDFALRREHGSLDEQNDARRAAAVYEYLTGEDLYAELSGMELVWKQGWLANG